MHLTDRERRAISSRNTLTDQEKRAKIKEWDLEVWTAFAPPEDRKIPEEKKSTMEYMCFCPYCAVDAKKMHKKKRGGVHDITAWIFHHANGDGLGFYCASCKTKHPTVYEFLGKGSPAAEEYAWNRFEIDAVGQGWYCPHPQRWAEISALAGKRRAAKYKADDERKRRENKIAYDLRNNIRRTQGL